MAQIEISELSIHLDSIDTVKKESLYSDKELAKIDSLLIEAKFNSPLYDTLTYVIKEIPDSISFPELNTEELKKRLATIDARTPFHLSYNPVLERVIKTYLKTRKRYYTSLFAKAQYYFPLFEQHLDRYNIPLEMKYLAIVESTLNARAKSGVGATGLWQFMYQTGKQYDLNISSYVDERQDPVKSTIAACEYLSDLYRIFGDWDLALAAYNSGPGNVSKAIKRSGGYKNYWNIRPFLPEETAGYVPAFYATMYLFTYAKEHGLRSDLPVVQHFETDTIQIKRTVSFDQISETIGVNSDVLEFLNPSYKLDIIPFVEDKKYKVRLPKAYTVTFLSKEEELYALADSDDAKREKPLPKYFEMNQLIRYKVKSGDYLGKIANKYGVRVSDIKNWNRLQSSRLRVGQRLSIYPKRLRETKEPKTKVSSKPKGEYTIYVVKEGDSLWTIAKKFPKVSADQIKKWNNIWSAKGIKPGTKLKIYKG